MDSNWFAEDSPPEDSAQKDASTAESNVLDHEPAVKKSRLDQGEAEQTETAKLDTVMEEDETPKADELEDEDMGIPLQEDMCRPSVIFSLPSVQTNNTDSRRKKPKVNGMVDFWRIQNNTKPPPERFSKEEHYRSRKEILLVDMFPDDEPCTSKQDVQRGSDKQSATGASRQSDKLHYEFLDDRPCSSHQMAPSESNTAFSSVSMERSDIGDDSKIRRNYSLLSNTSFVIDTNNIPSAIPPRLREEALFGPAVHRRVAEVTEEETKKADAMSWRQWMLPSASQFRNVRQSNIIPDQFLDDIEYDYDDDDDELLDDYLHVNHESSMEDDVFAEQFKDIMKSVCDDVDDSEIK